jgi:hypothetical protein
MPIPRGLQGAFSSRSSPRVLVRAVVAWVTLDRVDEQPGCLDPIDELGWHGAQPLSLAGASAELGGQRPRSLRRGGGRIDGDRHPVRRAGLVIIL